MTKAIELSQLGSNITVDSGNVGIGTDAPVQKLDVNGSIKSNNYLGPNTATGNVRLTVGTNTQNPSVALWARDHATYPGQTHILGRTSNASNIAGQIRFYQYTGSAWAITGMWGKNGYFGIRSSNSDPEVPLHIHQGSALDRTAYLTKAADTNFRLTAANGSGTNSSGQETARFGINYASTNAWGEYIKFVRGTGASNGSMGLYSSNTERIHINADGNVGIGTNNPVSKLEVRDSADGAALLRFNFDRSWTFRQRGTSSLSSLSLQAEVGNKYFNIENVNQETNLKMYAASDKTAGAFVVGEDATRVPGIDLQHGYILVGTATYASNQNKPILIAGTTTWDGTTGNWGSYGFQMRLKSNGTGVARLTIDDNGTERVCVEGGGNVGIGTNNPFSKLHVQGTSVQIASAFADNITYGGRTFTANHDIRSTSMRGGVLVRNMNDFRSETGAASFMHYDAYTTTAKSYAFRVSRGATLSDTFWVKSDGSMYAASGFTIASNITQQSNAPQHIFKENGTTYGNTNWALVRDGDSFSIRWNNAAPYAFRAGTSGGSVSSVFLRQNGLEVNSSGTVIQGSLSKGSGSFRIQHPLAELSETTDLVHSFVEAPDASNLYAGMVQLTDGVAIVNIDTAHRMTEGTFVALNHVQSWSSSNESGYAPVKCSISGNLLTIECQDTNSTDTVYYEVRGIRKDQHMIDTDWTDNEGRVITEPPKRVVPE